MTSELKINYSELEEKYWISTGDEVHWFDGPQAAQDGLRQLQIGQAVNEEVVLITKWLTRLGLTQCAAAIEARDYRK